MSFIGNVSTIVDNEKRFNILCHHVAKSNFSLASNYVEEIFTKSISNKDKFINLTKACLLVLRTPLLCLPLVNRATQFFLRFFSPKLTKEFVGSLDFFKTVEERKLRYSVKSFIDACIFYQTDPKTRFEDKAKFIRKIRESLDEKRKEELLSKLITHAEHP